MRWLVDLIHGTASTPAATAALATGHEVLVIGLVAALGLQLGHVRIFGVSIRVAGVLFVGLLFGNLGLAIDHPVLEFARDFGLVLFLYTIGLQIGPGFVSSLRRQGLSLNIMAACIVMLGVALTIAAGKLVLPRGDFPAVVGVFSGATTSTPSLAAATQALSGIASITPDMARQPGMQPALGYAVSYPFGVIGIIMSMYILKWIFRVDLKTETESLAAAQGEGHMRLAAVSVTVRNPAIDGMTVDELTALAHSKVVISRILHDSEAEIAVGDMMLSAGDSLLAVGEPSDIEVFKMVVGGGSEVDVSAVPSTLATRYVLVTQPSVIGRTVPALSLYDRHKVAITRISRGDVELPPTTGVPLMFGDRVRVVGGVNDIKAVGRELGDSTEQRDHPMLAPMFFGMALAVIIGSIPISLPGMPAPISLGLAGGALVSAIVLGRIGKIGPFVWYMPRSANLSMRKMGIVLFLSCVGLKAGDKFVYTLVHGHGLEWVACGVVITLVPVLVVGAVARIAGKLNFLPLVGLLSGSMTDSTALAFAGSFTGSEAPSVAYAAVYPLVMILRILAAQAMILFLR